jgi:hypothetical protein
MKPETNRRPLFGPGKEGARPIGDLTGQTALNRPTQPQKWGRYREFRKALPGRVLPTASDSSRPETILRGDNLGACCSPPLTGRSWISDNGSMPALILTHVVLLSRRGNVTNISDGRYRYCARWIRSTCPAVST